MADLGLGVAGAALVLIVYLDALSTTVVVREGAGPLTRRLTSTTWRTLLRLRRSRTGSSLLALGGGSLLFGTVVVWVALLWAGWWLIFLAGNPAVVDASTNAPATPLDVAYFTGFTLFTLGVGDFIASSGPWRLASAVAGFSGLFLVTLSITYLVGVVSAVVARRALAVHVHGLGGDAGAIASRGWTGRAFSSGYEQHLIALASEIATVAEQHLAYPILHTFRSSQAGTSAPLALAELDDAVQLLLHGLPPHAGPDRCAVLPLRHSLDRYLVAASTSDTGDGDGEEPRPLTLDALRAAGIPVVDDERFALDVDDDRRRVLGRLVASGGWTWPPPEDPRAGGGGRTSPR